MRGSHRKWITLGSSLRLRSRRPKWAAAASHAFAELFPFLGSHLCPALHHAAPPEHVRTRPATKPSEKDFAQNQQAEGLPETDYVPAKECGHQPVPEAHHHETKHNRGQRHE